MKLNVTLKYLSQELSVRELDHFLFGGLTLDTILTPAEREYCVRHELDAIVAKDEQFVPGYPGFPLFPGQSIGKITRAHRLFPLNNI